ncbi:MAG: hypothetical protein ACRYF4_05585 [Janthinobacterium lividum]
MRMTKEVWTGGVALALLLACGACTAGAQTTPGGQVVAPGTKGQRSGATPCNGPDATPAAANANDANCVEAAPGFASSPLNTPGDERKMNVVALVRVDSVVPRPPVTMPEGDSFSVIGSATLVKVRRAELKDCLATGKRISARANASTSTTCLDRKGELLAYEECKAGISECAVLTPQDIAKQQETVKP